MDPKNDILEPPEPDLIIFALPLLLHDAPNYHFHIIFLKKIEIFQFVGVVFEIIDRLLHDPNKIHLLSQNLQFLLQNVLAFDCLNRFFPLQIIQKIFPQ